MVGIHYGKAPVKQDTVVIAPTPGLIGSAPSQSFLHFTVILRRFYLPLKRNASTDAAHNDHLYQNSLSISDHSLTVYAEITLLLHGTVTCDKLNMILYVIISLEES